MLSKGLAARKGIFALSPAILCYLADIGLMSPPIFQARRRRVRRPSGGRPAPKNLSPNPTLRAAAKKSRRGEEPVNRPRVDGVAPGEAPQPLTLNHPALAPAATSSRGSLFCFALICSALTRVPRNASNPAASCAHSGITARSSRCTISARPLKPRMEEMSADERPRILSASSMS